MEPKSPPLTLHSFAASGGGRVTGGYTLSRGDHVNVIGAELFAILCMVDRHALGNNHGPFAAFAA